MRYAFLLGLFLLGCSGPSLTSRSAADEAAMRVPAGPFSHPAPPMRAAGGHDARALSVLRARGPVGLDALVAELAASADDETRAGLRDAIDQVAQQRDAWASHLYWYTDLEEAKRAARTTGRPILSLRLLGALTDELSCANSRFFRAILYPSPGVQRVLREQFVLHWSSERPAPVITIDFRDGRKLVRTVTGNSLHFVLDTEGRPLDAMPGLLGPSAFQAWLLEAAALFPVARKQGPDAVARHHADRLRVLSERYGHELVRAGFAASPLPAEVDAAEQEVAGDKEQSAPPSAAMAMSLAVSKKAVEAPLVGAVGLRSPPPAIEAAPWARLSLAHVVQARIDEAGRRMLRAKNPHDWSNPQHPAPLSDDAFAQMVASFERSVAEDTVKNLYGLHPFVHRWLRDDPEMSLEELDARVYGELFLTLAGDPWLGLVPPRVFSGIADDGIVVAR